MFATKELVLVNIDLPTASTAGEVKRYTMSDYFVGSRNLVTFMSPRAN